MDRMTPEEAAQAILDCADNKEMQFHQIPRSHWQKFYGEWCEMDFQEYIYRVKPEPREWYLFPTGDKYLYAATPEQMELKHFANAIKVREVLEDE